MTAAPTFLSLPPEIRNRICQYALTPATGLVYRENKAVLKQKAVFCDSENEASEFNQLKYVSRQLYMETAALELKYSPLLIFGRLSESGQPCGAQAVEFLSSMSPQRRAWLAVIVMQEKVAIHNSKIFIRDTPETLLLLDKICIQNPNLSMKYELPNWRLDATSRRYSYCLFSDMLYSTVLRGDSMDSLLHPAANFDIAGRLNENGSGDDPMWMKAVRVWRGKYTVSLTATNFRFFPLNLDEDTRRSKEIAGLATAFSAEPWIVKDMARAQIRQWIELGL
ncbi:hypothetical protein N0V95_003770 [Ascochyta clinopodiicola]|nr:hypothetical protein N0V95_003770 [Ascochyta clinopodiicola]